MTNRLDLRSLQSEVKDQGRRATCVACAATAAHEMLRGESVDLSLEFLHWAAKRRDGLPASSRGTTLEAAAAALARDGQPPETTWRYDDRTDHHSPAYTPPDGATEEALARLLGGEAVEPDPSHLREVMDLGQAVVLGLTLFDTWDDVGPGGQIAMPDETSRWLGGHAVVVVGYGDEELLIRNSWGGSWGLGGYGFVGDAYVRRFQRGAWSFIGQGQRWLP